MNLQQQATASLRVLADRLTAAEHAVAEARSALTLALAAVDAMPSTASSTPEALTTVEVAHALNLSRSTVAEMLRREEIRSVKLGGARRVFRADLETYIRSVRNAA